MPTLVPLIAGAILLLLLVGLVLLGIVARRQHQRADVSSEHVWGVPLTDEVEVVAAYAEAAAAAAEAGLDEADRAQFRAVQAAAECDIAERRYRLALKQAETAAEPHRLVQRAALDAYQRRQLSVAELNRIWQHTQVMVEPAPRPASPPLGWELRVREARRRYDQARTDAARAQEEARRKAATAATLAEEARAAESHLSVAMRSASTGLVGLLRATWADPVTG